MSFTRSLRRAKSRRTGQPFPSQQTPYRPLDGGGYAALHPTKGWRTFSPKRVRAQGRLAKMNLGLIQRNARKAKALNVLPRAA